MSGEIRLAVLWVIVTLVPCGLAHGNMPSPSAPCHDLQECDGCHFESYGGLCIDVCHGGDQGDDDSGEEYCSLECVTNLDSPLLDACPDTQPPACSAAPIVSATAGAALLTLTMLSTLLRRRRAGGSRPPGR
ncbi:MAG: MYXO-CTERM sorting domain-containing protein [Gemmatimonadota bacterium]